MSFYCPAAGVEINPSKISAVVIKFTAGLSFIVCMIAGVLLFFHQPSAHPITAPDSNWTAQDITYINPSISAEKSLIAVYGRKISGSIQIRLDFIPLIPERIELDIFTSGARQPLPLIIQNGGQLLQANQNQGQVALSPFISGQDSIVLSLTVPVAVRDPEKTSVQVITKDQPGSQNWVAYPQVGLFSSNPVPAANVILGFWNTLPSSSPAQILRRWDGAHTGPFGQRHGLKTLIDQSQKYQAPLLLLDLDQPETLSALDLLQKLSVVKQGQSTGLLILPSFEPSNYLDPLPGWANIKDSREISKASLVYHPVAENGDFLPTLCKMDLNGRCIVLKPFSNDIDRFGLSKAGKIALASKLAPSSSPTPLVLGGDLPTSPWADSFSAPAAFRYISSHPWIKIWDQYDLDLYLKYYPSTSSQLKHRIAPPRIASPYFTNNQSTALDSLTNAPPGALTTLAWNTYFNLTSLPASPQLIALRSHYFLGIGQLLIASDWAEHPYTMNQSIQIGISSLYILSNEDHFLLFDHSDGSLLFAVSQNNGTPQIIIAPTSLFAVGLSSPDSWTDNALRSDPAVIPGAFVDTSTAGDKYQSSPISNGNMTANSRGMTLPNGVSFTNNGRSTKSYILVGNQLQISIFSPITLKTSIPIVLDPNRRFNPGYRAFLKQFSVDTPNQVQSNVPFDQTWFYDSINLWDQPENPDLDYPSSYTMPIPTGKVDLMIPAGKQVQMTINLDPKY